MGFRRILANTAFWMCGGDLKNPEKAIQPITFYEIMTFFINYEMDYY